MVHKKKKKKNKGMPAIGTFNIYKEVMNELFISQKENDMHHDDFGGNF